MTESAGAVNGPIPQGAPLLWRERGAVRFGSDRPGAPGVKASGDAKDSVRLVLVFLAIEATSP